MSDEYDREKLQKAENAVIGMARWSDTPEGHRYWADVHSKIRNLKEQAKRTITLLGHDVEVTEYQEEIFEAAIEEYPTLKDILQGD